MSTERIQDVLQSVNQRVRELFEVDRLYVALYDPRRGELSFPFVADGRKRPKWPARPYRGGAALPDRVIETKSPLALERDFAAELAEQEAEYWPDGAKPLSWLGVPLCGEGGQVLGALVIENRRQPRAFGESGQRTLPLVARQAAPALENLRLYERLKRKADSMEVVNRLGQQLAAGIHLGEQEILELIHKNASELMDTDNMYIALYDKATDTVRFGLAYVDGNQVDTEDTEKWPGWQPRRGGKGRTEWIIHNRKPLLIRTRDESVDWYQKEGKEYIGEPFAAWVGVPMISGDSVLGVIATYHKTRDYVYDEDDQLVLSLMAGQAAIAIQNARNLTKTAEIERIKATEAARSDFIHRLGNFLGSIPPRLHFIDKQYLQTTDNIDPKAIANELHSIEDDITQMHLEIRQTLEAPITIERRQVNVNILLQSAVIRLESSSSYKATFVTIREEYAEGLPPVFCRPQPLFEAVLALLQNAVDAVVDSGEEGSVFVSSRLKEEKPAVEIVIRDTGCGIPDEEKPFLFEPFFTTKPRGTGYGLWRARKVVRELGGDVEITSEVGIGTTVLITIPLEEKQK